MEGTLGDVNAHSVSIELADSAAVQLDGSVAPAQPGDAVAPEQPSSSPPSRLSLRTRRAIRSLKKAACCVALISPVFSLLLLDGVDTLSTVTTVIVPILGSFIFLLIVAALLTYGVRGIRLLTYGGDTCESSAATQKERSVVAAIQALPCHTVVEGDTEQLELECAMCLCEVVAGDCLRTLPCKHAFHQECIDRWLVHSQAYNQRQCPMCKLDPLACCNAVVTRGANGEGTPSSSEAAPSASEAAPSASEAAQLAGEQAV